MAYTMANFQSAIEREMHGRSVARLQDINETAYHAGLILLAEIDPKETERVTQISPQVFDNVDVYSAPSDYKSWIDIEPSAGRVAGSEFMDDFRRTSARSFRTRRNIEAPMFSESWNNGTRSLLLRKYPTLTGNKIQLESYDATTGFTAGGDAGTLAANTLNFVQGSGALSFAISGATGVSYLEKTIGTQDLTNHRLLASWFERIYIPSGYSAFITSIEKRHGSSSGAYWARSVTTQHDGTAFKDGWNLLRFDWSSAAQTGVVDVTKMVYTRTTINSTVGTAMAGVLLDDFNIQLGTMYDLHYYSNYLFRSSAGVWIEKPTATDGSDIINLSPDAYHIFSDIGALLACSEVKSLADDYMKISARVGYPKDPNDPFKGSLGQYKRMYPSQRPVQSESLYDFGV